MTKNIDITDEIAKTLQELADEDKRSLKNYIEVLLIKHAIENEK